MSMCEPFTEHAWLSIVLAQEEAQRLGNRYIGTEHILLGIISEGGSHAAKVLISLGVSPAGVRENIVTIVESAKPLGRQESLFTPRAKNAIALAFGAAHRLKHNYLGTEHLLLGLIDESEGIALRVLMNLGVDIPSARAQVMALFEEDDRSFF